MGGALPTIAEWEEGRKCRYILLLGILSRTSHAVIVEFVCVEADESPRSYDCCQKIMGTLAVKDLIIIARNEHTIC